MLLPRCPVFSLYALCLYAVTFIAQADCDDWAVPQSHIFHRQPFEMDLIVPVFQTISSIFSYLHLLIPSSYLEMA